MTQVIESNRQTFHSQSLADTDRIGKLIAEHLLKPACVYLEGELGAGKTTLCKSIIQSLGYQGEVTSPTYNLIQEYRVDNGVVYHMDLYRLNSPEELEFLAVEDLWCDKSIFLIEWPSKGGSLLLEATHQVTIVNELMTESNKHIILTKL